MNVYIGPNRILPDTYQEVEYIGTTGTQFINTGLYAGNNIQVETKIVVNSTSQPQIVFACYKSSGSDDLPNYYGLAGYQNRWYYGLNGSEGNGGTYSPTIGTEYKIVYNNANNYININGSDVLNCAGTTGYAGTTLGIAVRANRTLSGAFKYYYFRMYNKTTGAYERDFVPCYRKADNVIGMYDLVNNQFYTNSGSGTFTKGNSVVRNELKNAYIGEYKGRLPSAYQEVEYIRGSSSGGQYIDTGMANVTNKTKVEYSYIPYTKNDGIIFMDNTWDSEGFGNGWDYYYYKNYPGANMPSNSVGTKVTIVIANDGCSKDGSNIRVPNKSSLSTSGTILLMANRRGGNIDGTPGRDCALYYYKRWENGTLVQEFIPCYRKQDGVIGLYDLVNNQFYTNSGSGTFTKGPDVN